MDNARDAVHCSTVQLFLTGISVLAGIGPQPSVVGIVYTVFQQMIFTTEPNPGDVTLR